LPEGDEALKDPVRLRLVRKDRGFSPPVIVLSETAGA
jgi:hypothetical protein